MPETFPSIAVSKKLYNQVFNPPNALRPRYLMISVNIRGSDCTIRLVLIVAHLSVDNTLRFHVLPKPDVVVRHIDSAFPGELQVPQRRRDLNKLASSPRHSST